MTAQVILNALARALEVLADADRQAMESEYPHHVPRQNKGQFCSLVQGAIETADKEDLCTNGVKWAFNRYAGVYKVDAWVVGKQ